jgi:hypothetical protein
MRLEFVLLVSLISACDTPPKEDYHQHGSAAAEPPPAPPTKEKPAVKKALTPDELGTCHLTATGAVTADQTSKGGKPATNISYWYTPEEQKTMMGVDGFVINCEGNDIHFRMLPGGGKQDGMPFKPKTYTFAAGKGDANLSIGFGKQSIDKPSGTIDVTAFNSHHIAGTIALSGKLLPGGGDEKLTGSFDLICPNLSACDK